MLLNTHFISIKGLNLDLSNFDLKLGKTPKLPVPSLGGKLLIFITLYP